MVQIYLDCESATYSKRIMIYSKSIFKNLTWSITEFFSKVLENKPKLSYPTAQAAS